MKADPVRVMGHLAEIRKNSLIHRHWKVDDTLLIENIKNGRQNFDRLVMEIEAYAKKLK